MSRSTRRWAEGAVVYQIYPRSFKDSNSDGIGDLPGIIDKLDYLKNLGISAIWLSPFYRSPMADFGYDVADYRDVDPIFGNIEDFKELVSQAHLRDIKVMVDLVINHTSDQHEWFKRSRQSKDNEYSDWYNWHDAKSFEDNQPLPPNNWIEVFSGGSAWQWDASRQQFYLHSFNIHQPDLNWENPDVREAIKEVMRYWLDLGVDGFRADAVSFVSKDPSLDDDPINPDYQDGKDSKYARLLTVNSRAGPKLFKYLSDIASVLNEVPYRSRQPFMVMEAYPGETENNYEYLAFYKGVDSRVAAPFNFEGLSLSWNAKSWRKFLTDFHSSINDLDQDCVANYAFSNHDNPRIASRLGEDRARAAVVLLLTLPGMVYIYNGDEIGMKDGIIPPEYVQDPSAVGGLDRDPSRTPMLWNSEYNAGFSDGDKVWLPINEDFEHANVKTESSDSNSYLTLYKNLIRLRQSSTALKYGDFLIFDSKHESLLAFTRRSDDESVTVFINMSDQDLTLQPDKSPGNFVLSSSPRTLITSNSSDKITFRPNEAAIFKN